MARQPYVRVVDDLDKTVIEEGQGETFTFAFQGKSYTIDLVQKNADEFRKVMQKYTSVATQEVSRLPRVASSSPKSNKEELGRIREWASSQGIEVNARGRIAQSVIDQYHAAN